jgi:hypothetical protein
MGNSERAGTHLEPPHEAKSNRKRGRSRRCRSASSHSGGGGVADSGTPPRRLPHPAPSTWKRRNRISPRVAGRAVRRPAGTQSKIGGWRCRTSCCLVAAPPSTRKLASPAPAGFTRASLRPPPPRAGPPPLQPAAKHRDPDEGPNCKNMDREDLHVHP